MYWYLLHGFMGWNVVIFVITKFTERFSPDSNPITIAFHWSRATNENIPWATRIAAISGLLSLISLLSLWWECQHKIKLRKTNNFLTTMELNCD